MKILSLTSITILFCFQSIAQLPKKAIVELKNHVYFLADDKLEGRLTGSKGELLAADYLSKHFQKLKLKPMGNNQSYLQPFDFTAKVRPKSGSYISIHKHQKLSLFNDFFPLPQSPDLEGTFDVVTAGFGFYLPELSVNDYADSTKFLGKLVLVDLSNADGSHPHSKFYPYQSIANKVNWAAKFGAKGVLFFTNDTLFELPTFDSTRRSGSFEIPAYLINRYSLVDSIFRNGNLSIKCELERELRTGYNVLALLDNKAPNTVVVGAHYDHLGYGELGGSLHRPISDHLVHNGADDNASGTAGLLQLASYFSNNPPKELNILFVAFSGEELGLLGSGFLIKNLPIDVKNISYMLNMDMIGRLNTKEPNLGINGVGTSPAFNTVIDTTQRKPFRIKTTESGIGSSDHTSFYLANLPVLHFFTGTHADYHRPTDDADKINYNGMVLVLDYIITLIDQLPKTKLTFTKSKDNTTGSARMKVTLGIVPDYFFEGNGLRLDGVSAGKPAEKGGLQKGDIIQKINQFTITDINAYMQALSKLKSGTEVEVTFLRDGKPLTIKLNL